MTDMEVANFYYVELQELSGLLKLMRMFEKSSLQPISV